MWILLEQETVSGSGISWAICKSAPRSRQITTSLQYPTTLFFTGRMPFMPPNQQRQSTEGNVRQSPVSYGHNLYTCKISRNQAVQKCGNRWTDMSDLITTLLIRTVGNTNQKCHFIIQDANRAYPV